MRTFEKMQIDIRRAREWAAKFGLTTDLDVDAILDDIAILMRALELMARATSMTGTDDVKTRCEHFIAQAQEGGGE